MSDMLKIKVALELENPMMVAKNLANQIDGISVPPIKVDLKVGEITGLENLKNLDFTSVKDKFQDAFKIDTQTLSNLRDTMKSIEKIMDTTIPDKRLEKFQKFSDIFSNLGNSFGIDNTTLSRFDKMNDMLKEFNSLSKEAQDVLLKKSTATAKGNADDLGDKIKADSRMSIQEFQNAIENQQNAIDKALRESRDGNLKSVTRYLDATDGLKEIVRKQIGTWTTLTEQTFSDGSKLGKLTYDVESNLKKMENIYKSSSDSIRKYSTELHKALAGGDLGKASDLQNVIEVFEKTRDKIKNEVDKSPFSKEMGERFLGIDTLNDLLKDMELNAFDDKVLKKQVNDYVSSIEKKANEIESIGKELKKANADGLTDYAKNLTSELKKANKELSNLYNMDSMTAIFPDDIKKRVDLKRQVTDMVQDIEDASKLYNSKLENVQKNKQENSSMNKFLQEYKQNTNEIIALEKQLATALGGEQFNFASDLQTKISSLQEQQVKLKENAKALAGYEQALKDVQAVERKSKDNVDLHNSYLENKALVTQQKAESKELEKQLKADEKRKSQELKAMSDAQKNYWQDLLKYEDSVASAYKSITKTLSTNQNDYIKAIADDNLVSANQLQKAVEFWNAKKSEILSEIKKTNFTQDFYNKISDIDSENNLFTGKFEAQLSDRLNKQMIDQTESKGKQLVAMYEKMVSNIAKKENQLLSSLANGDMEQYEAFSKTLDEYKERTENFVNSIDFGSFSENLAKEFANIDMNYGLTQSENIAKINDGLSSKLAKDNEKLQKALISEYEKISNAVALKEADLVKAMAKGDEASVEAIGRTLDVLYDKHKNVVSKIRQSGLDDILKAQIDEINKFNSVRLGEVDSAIADKMQSNQLKEESQAVKELLAEYKQNASQLEKYKKELLTVDEGSRAESELNKRIASLEHEQSTIKQNVSAYEEYAQALDKINFAQRKLDDNVALASAKNSDKVDSTNARENEKILAQISKERENLAKALEKEQKALIDTYEKYALKEAQLQKQFISSVVNEDMNKADGLEKSIERYSRLKNNILKEINDKGLNDIYGDRLGSINETIRLDLDITNGNALDKINKKELKESASALKDFVSEYDSLYKKITNEQVKSASLSQKGRDVEAQAHRDKISSLQSELAIHEKKISSLKLVGEAEKEIARIRSHYEGELAVGMSKVGQDIQVSSFKEFKKNQDEVVARYKKLYAEQEKFNKALGKTASTDAFTKTKAEIDKLEKELKSLQELLTSSSHKDDIELFRSDRALAQSRELTQSIEKVRNEAKDLLEVSRQLEGSEFINPTALNSVKSMFASLSSGSLDGTVEDLRDMNVLLGDAKNLLEKIQKIKLDKMWESDKQIKLDGLDDAIAKFKRDFENVLDDTSMRALEDSARRLASVMDKESFSQGARELTAQLKHARNEMENLNVSTSKYNFFEDLYDNMRTFQLADIIVDGVQSALYGVKDIIIEIDSAMANVRKVALPIDVDSIDKLDEIKNKAIQISKEVGVTSAEVINSIADTIQSGGYAMQEAIEIAKQTMMLANVGEMTQESATSGVVTMLSGFKLDPLKEISVVVDGVTKSTNQLTDSMDQVNYVGNNFAISTEGLLSAFQGGATVLQEYGIGLTDTIALITGANKTLQDPSVVGNGLKSIGINLQGIKADAYSGELALNKTALALEKIAGVDIFKDKQSGQIKSMIDIMDELYVKWDSFNDEERAGLAEAIAGKFTIYYNVG